MGLYKRVMMRIAMLAAAFVALVLLSAMTPPASARPGQVAGLSANLLRASVDDAEQNRQLDLMVQAGAGIMRVEVGWSTLEEKGKGQYEQWYLDQLDALVLKAEQRGIKLVLTVTDSPCWASSAPESIKQGCTGAWWEVNVQRYPPVNEQDYADAFAFLVSRYGTRVAGYEIWNEPNDDYYFRSPDQTADYVRIVRAAYPAAKAANPAVTVIAGSLSESQTGFAEELFQHGIGGYFDAWSVHPYSGDASPYDPLTDDYIANSFARGVPAMRELLLRHGEDKPIWLTEFGWNTSTIRDSEAWENGVNEETQARYIEQAIIQASDWPYVPVIVIYELQDRRNDPNERNANFGILRYDGTFKPAFAAFRRGALALPSLTGPPRPVTPLPDRRRRLRVWVARRDGGVYIRGVGEPREVARVRVYRYLREKQRFARRPTYTFRVKLRASGRFKRRLESQRGGRRWRVRAKYARSG